jgi:hypothetical protein
MHLNCDSGFIQLVDEEKWDDEGATFMALRQTLLTALLAPPPDATRKPLWMERISVLDLTDPVLASTGLDNVLMDMMLREFMVPVEGTKKLIGQLIIQKEFQILIPPYSLEHGPAVS